MSQIVDIIMKVTYQESIEYKAINRLESIPGSIGACKDFSDLGSYRQVSVLNKLYSPKKTG